MKIPDLREQHGFKVAEMRGLVEKAEGAKRDLSGEEKARFDSLKGETKAIEERIARAETIAEFERRSDATPVDDASKARELRNYSVAKALHESMAGKLTGCEAEFHSELAKGRETRGIMIPVEILLGERRALQKAGSAGNLVGTDHLTEQFVDRLRPALKVESLGARVLSGLVGNIEIPRLTASATATWVAEDGSATRSDQTLDKITLAPKTITGEVQFSRKLMMQSAPAVESIVRGDLAWVIAAGLDAAAIKGGGANEPTGVLSLAGLSTVALGTNGAAPTIDNLADLAALPDIANVEGATAFLTNSKVRKVGRKAKDTVGQYYGLDKFFVGERYDISNQIPSNLTKGSGTNLSAIIYGAWADLFIAYWSAVDVLVNPYHQDVASKGGVLVHAFLDADIAARHVESFAAIIDAVTT